MNDLQQTLCEIQDHLAPELDGIEQMLYHYLFRHTHLKGRDTVIVPARSIGPKIGKGRKGAAELARNNIPKKLRSLETKGAIEILERTRDGTVVRVILPRAIPGLIRVGADSTLTDLTGVDFFSAAENRQRILQRDGCRCRYCLRELNAENFSIDHIVPQAEGGDNTYRNVVAVCFECNSKKQSKAVKEFLRCNYRAGIISREDFDACLLYVEAVRAGKIVPI